MAHCDDFHHVFFATIDGSRARVRPVTMIRFENELWVTTDFSSPKIKQVQKNPNIEISYLFKDDPESCARISGIAELVKDRKTRTRLAKHCPFFVEHWKDVDDHNFALLRIVPTEVFLVRPNMMKHETLC